MNKTRGRETLYKGIKMRSRLEADYAAYLDRSGRDDWDYEPECFAGPGGQWLPDFRRNFPEVGNRYVEYIEVKSFELLTEADKAGSFGPVDDILRRMAQTWWSNRGAILVLDFWEYGSTEPPATIVGSISRFSDHGWRLRLRGSGDSEWIWPGCMPDEAEEWRKAS